MLEFKDVHTYYGPIHALKGVNYHVDEGEIVCLLGANGAGKSTTMKTILGLVRPTQGTVTFKGRRIDNMPTGEIVKAGISPVPEARRIFGRMTVRENLEMGAYTRSSRKEFDEDLVRVFDLFPRLKERQTQVAGTMSG